MYIHTKTLFTSKVKHDHIIFRISRLIRISTLNMSCSRHSYKTRDHTSFFSPLNYILNTDPDIQNLRLFHLYKDLAYITLLQLVSVGYRICCLARHKYPSIEYHVIFDPFHK